METKNVICLTDPNDIAFSSVAQKATVTSATLPSGLKVPDIGQWLIIDHYLVNISYIKKPILAPH
tara:strand:- start:997 stop:1191 length:195 start_codon:yes stop_codon:yes gene_type:complete